MYQKKGVSKAMIIKIKKIKNKMREGGIKNKMKKCGVFHNRQFKGLGRVTQENLQQVNSKICSLLL